MESVEGKNKSAVIYKVAQYRGQLRSSMTILLLPCLTLKLGSANIFYKPFVYMKGTYPIWLKG